MNIFVIGNGFDLQHNLPTSYSQFIDYCDGVIRFHIKRIMPLDLDLYLDFTSFEQDEPALWSEFASLMDCFWIDYFIKNRLYQSDKWADFEAQIENVVKDILDERAIARKAGVPNDGISPQTYGKYNLRGIKTYREAFNYLNKELKKLNRALDIYMDYCIMKKLDKATRMPIVDTINPDKLLSFNYTRTFFEIYGVPDDYEFVHGKADAKHSFDECNLVLGYDDHYESNKAILELVPFEKYYQRIVNKTGANYSNWFPKVSWAVSEEKRNVYFYGHSMSPADGDILKEIIMFPNTKTTIYYRKEHEEDRAEMIKNLACVLTPTELIRLTGEPNPKVSFVPI